MGLDITLKCAHCGASNYDCNITHNLNTMADKAGTGLYIPLWYPEKLNIKYAKDLILILKAGLKDLKARPKYFKQFDDPDSWGTYEQFVPFVEEYLEACKKYPDSIIEISR
jgi:hypothetical protein